MTTFDEHSIADRATGSEWERNQQYLLARGWVRHGACWWVDPAPRRHRAQISKCTMARALQRQKARDHAGHIETGSAGATEYNVGHCAQVFRARIARADTIVLGDIESGRVMRLSRYEARELVDALTRALAEKAPR